jgi:hypothetical protein
VAITYSLKKAAEESGLSMRTLQYAIKRGELESILVGRRRLVVARSLEKFLFRAAKTASTQESKRGQ